jgi:hypothetical protein
VWGKRKKIPDSQNKTQKKKKKQRKKTKKQFKEKKIKFCKTFIMQETMQETTEGNWDGVTFTSLTGKKLYSSTRHLNSGAGGAVFLAEDSNYQKIALKALTAIRMTKSSSRAIRAATVELSHNNIVWMELQDGELVATKLSGSRHVQLDLQSCIQIFGISPKEGTIIIYFFFGIFQK